MHTRHLSHQAKKMTLRKNLRAQSPKTYQGLATNSNSGAHDSQAHSFSTAGTQAAANGSSGLDSSLRTAETARPRRVFVKEEQQEVRRCATTIICRKEALLG